MPTSRSKIHITLTINLKDGREINDIEGEAVNLSHVSDAVERMIDERGVKDGEWSSLVIVTVRAG
jgi:hypothetical protein